MVIPFERSGGSGGAASSTSPELSSCAITVQASRKVVTVVAIRLQNSVYLGSDHLPIASILVS